MTKTANLQVTTPEQFAEAEAERMERTSLEDAVATVEGMLAVRHFYGDGSCDNHYIFWVGLLSVKTLESLKELYEAAGWKAGYTFRESDWQGHGCDFMLWLHD